MEKQTTMNKLLSVRMSEADYKALCAIAQQEYLSVSSFIRQLIAREIEKRKEVKEQ